MKTLRTRPTQYAILALAVCVLVFAVLAKRSQYPDAPLDPHFGKSLRYEQAVSRPATAPDARALTPEFIVVGRVVPLAEAPSAAPDSGALTDGRAPPVSPSL